jgi:hypothetical protein
MATWRAWGTRTVRRSMDMKTQRANQPFRLSQAPIPDHLDAPSRRQWKRLAPVAEAACAADGRPLQSFHVIAFELLAASVARALQSRHRGLTQFARSYAKDFGILPDVACPAPPRRAR